MINLYAHGGSGNHGCEAIVRSTVKILQNSTSMRLFSAHIDEDQKYGVNKICQLYQDRDRPIQKGTKEWFLSGIETKATGRIDLAIKYRRPELLSNISAGDVCLSIGGDNYCYAGTDKVVALNNNLRKQGARLVLWGCSIEPEVIQQSEIAEDLSRYELITARESITFEALKRVNPNTVLVPDTAFALDRCDLQLPENWKYANMVGINASPLILNEGSEPGVILEAYQNLMDTILTETDMGIALVPHVVWTENDDRTVLKQLYQKFAGSERVVLIEDHNCTELKGYIARCRLFVGARTHATIAAYSNCVPTLVLGYSVKSKGIAKDIFGTYENYVLPVQNIRTSGDLSKGFLWLMENEARIRKMLESVMPEYIGRIDNAKRALNDLCV